MSGSSSTLSIRSSWLRNAPSPCTWRNSAMRSGDRVMRTAPDGWNPADSPVSAGSTSRYRRTDAARISMMVGLWEKCEHMPAACHVEPAVSSLFSRSTMSVQPRLVRWYASETPMMPPPTITTRVSSVIASAPCRPLRSTQRTIRQFVLHRFATLRDTEPSSIPSPVFSPRVPTTMRSQLRRLAWAMIAPAGSPLPTCVPTSAIPPPARARARRSTPAPRRTS